MGRPQEGNGTAEPTLIRSEKPELSLSKRVLYLGCEESKSRPSAGVAEAAENLESSKFVAGTSPPSDNGNPAKCTARSGASARC
jgi:hypothetical protein